MDQLKDRAAGWPDSSLRQRVVDLLVDRLKLDRATVDRAELLATRTSRPVEQVLNQMGAVPDQSLAEAYAEICAAQVWRPELEPPDPSLELEVPAQYLAARRLLALMRTADRLVVAAYDPLDDEGLAGLAFATGLTIEVRVATPSDFRRAESEARGAPVAEAPVHDRRLEVEVQRVSDPGADSDASRLVASVLETAAARRASDVHFEPRRHDLRVRLRIDGRLTELQTAPLGLAGSVLSRVKVLSNLDLGERRLPQDGRATFVVEGRSVEARVSIVPTVFGEAAVLRLLDRVGLQFDFASLGIEAPEVALLQRAMQANHGIFLVSGPTGSGKTTTLYALLNGLASADKKILSIEDPVEHHFQHVNQVQVAPQIGLTFASALRAFLRQDPDVILVGEIRDRETAAVAIQAAMTGHLVLASVHANDAVRVVPRLLDMGVEPYQLAAAMLGAAAQRLVRRLCLACKTARSPNAAERVFIQAVGGLQPEQVCDPAGCAACGGTGFRGRIALIEGYICDEPISAAIAQSEPIEVFAARAQDAGLRAMALDGVGKAGRGLTNMSEVMSMVAT